MLFTVKGVGLWVALFATSSLIATCNEKICSATEELNDHSSTLLVSVQSTVEDLERQQSKRSIVHRSSYYGLVGSSHSEIAAKINKFISSHKSVNTVVPCSQLSASEIASFASRLRVFTDTSMKHFYPEDDGRQVHLPPWEIPRIEEDSKARRVAQCAETVKLWAHHVPTSTKTSSLNVVLPTLPANFEASDLIASSVIAEAQLYNKSVSCVAGHTVKDIELDQSSSQDPYDFDWPHWPIKTHFRAKGHGPYPFWQFGTGAWDGWVLNESYSTPYLYQPGTDMEVWHNTQKKATKFYHSSCQWDWLGFGELSTHPCAAVMLNGFGPDGKWYLYTADSQTMASDEKFCCESTWNNDNGKNLGTINRKFVDEMVFVDEADYEGDYYKGRSKRYVMSMLRDADRPESGDEPQLAINVFYETDMEGRPLRFGEWGQNQTFNEYLHDYDFPLIYEEFDPESFADRTKQVFSDSVFDLPTVCMSDLHGCHPGRHRRER
jgi:hypothetical protein